MGLSVYSFDEFAQLGRANPADPGARPAQPQLLCWIRCWSSCPSPQPPASAANHTWHHCGS